MVFQYPPGFFEPLDSSSEEVRLLELHPGPVGSIVECTLSRLSRFRMPEYSALSYCWGSNTQTVEIRVNNQHIPVTKNLGVALQQLRKRGVQRLWVDALCISQEDDQEKSDQIRYIRLIYSQAKATYAWLGDAEVIDANNVPQQALLDATTLRLQPPTENFRLGTRYRSLFRRRRAISASHDIESKLHDCTLKDQQTASQLLNSASALFSCEYWKRRWIVQEIAVSRNVLVCYGDEIMGLDRIQGILDSDKQIAPGNKEHVRQILTFRKSFQTQQPILLCETIINTHNFESEREHDRIFAVLGICDDGPSIVPIPSYAQNIQSILVSVAKYTVRRHMSLDFLLLGERSIPSDLPSWTPDILSSRIDLDTYKRATKWRRNGQPPYITEAFDQSSDKVSLEGVPIGTIVALTATLGGSDTTQLGSIPPDLNQAITTYYSQHTTRITHAMLECLFAPRFELGYMTLHRSPLSSLVLLTKQPNRLDQWLASLFGEPIDTASAATLEKWTVMHQNFEINGIALGKRLQVNTLTCLAHLPKRSISILLLWLLAMTGGVAGIGIAFAFRIPVAPPVLLVVTLCLFIGLTFHMWRLFVKYRFIRHKLHDSAYGMKHNPRKLAICDNGIIAATCPEAAVGDKVCLIAGCSTGVTLRQKAGGDPDSRMRQYQLRGKAFPALKRDDWKKYTAFSWEPHRIKSMSRMIVGGYSERGDDDEYQSLIEKHQKEKWWEKFTVV